MSAFHHLSRTMSACRRLSILGIGIMATVFFLIACTVTLPEPAALPSAAPAETAALRISTTTDFIADWVSEVGGPQVSVTPILPTGADPHHYQPGPQDVALWSQADLVYQVGLGLEANWVTDLIEATHDGNTKVIAVGELVDVLTTDHAHHDEHDDAHHDEHDDAHHDEHDDAHHDEHDDAHHDEHDDAHHDEHDDTHAAEYPDPHFWLDPVRVQAVVTAIALHLSDLAPEHAEAFQARAVAYNTELDALHTWISAQVEHIPAEARLLVTGHDFMLYFAQRYGFTMVGSMTGDTDTAHAHEAPAHDLATLAEQISELGIKAIFVEHGHQHELAQRIAEEANLQQEVRFLLVSLGSPGSGADSYIDMMRTNTETLVEALQ